MLVFLVLVAAVAALGCRGDHADPGARAASAADVDSLRVAAFRTYVLDIPPWDNYPGAEDLGRFAERVTVCLSLRGPDAAFGRPEYDPLPAAVGAARGARIDSYPASACEREPAPPHWVRVRKTGAPAVLVWIDSLRVDGDSAWARVGRHWRDGRTVVNRAPFARRQGGGWYMSEQ